MKNFLRSNLSLVRLGPSDASPVFSLASKVGSGFFKNLNGIEEFLTNAERRAKNLSIGIYRRKKLVGYVLACIDIKNVLSIPSLHPKNTDGIFDLHTGICVADIAFENNNRFLAIRLLRNFLKLTRLTSENDCVSIGVFCSEKPSNALFYNRCFIKKSFIKLGYKKTYLNKNDNAIDFLCLEVSYPKSNYSKSLYQKLQCKVSIENNNRIIVGVLEKYNAFEILCPYWNSLLEKTPDAIGLQEIQFLKSWYINIGWPCRLYFIVVLCDENPVVIIPFQINEVTVLYKKIKRMAFLGLNKEMDRQTILFENKNYSFIKNVVDFLVSNKKEWDQIVLLEQKLESSFSEKFGYYMKEAGFLIGCISRPDCPFVKINGTWDAYLKSKNRNFRKSIKRKIEALKNKGELDFDVVWPFEGDNLLDRYLQVEARSWKCGAEAAVSKTSGHLAFYRDIAKIYGQRGLFKFGFLYLNKIPIAATFGFGWNQNFYSLQICHDERFSKESPGFVLTALELENMFKDGRFSIFDFLGGALHNKRSWSTNSDHTQNIFVNRLNFFGSFYHFIIFTVKPLLIKFKIIKRHY